MTEDVRFLLGTIGTVLVLCVVLYGVRRAISSQAWRDVLGDQRHLIKQVFP